MALLKFLHLFTLFSWLSLFFASLYALWQKKGEVFNLKKIFFKLELPFMAVALALGGLLLHVNPPNWKAPWLHMKLTAVMLLVIAEGLHGKGLCQKKTRGSGRWLALFVITSLLVLGVLASVYIMKPKFELAWGLNGFYPG